MTDEKLKKEAEEWVNLEYDNSYFPDCNFSARLDAVEAFLAGAEPREKRIAELEKENAEAKDIIEDLITKIPASLVAHFESEKERAEKFLGWE